MIINVTADCIARGTLKNAGSCPVALAVKEQTRFQDVLVELDSISVYYGTAFAVMKTSNKIESFISAFDLEKEVKTFSFEAPDEWRK